MKFFTTVIYSLCLSIISACSHIESAVGGDCGATNSIEIAQVINISASVELQSETGHRYKLAAEKFTQEAQPGDYYQLHIFRHSGGGCQPWSIKRVSKLSMFGLSLKPSPGQMYQGAFILSASQRCAQQATADCGAKLKLSNHFDLQQLRVSLTSIEPKSLNACSAAVISLVWEDIIAVTKESRLIACVNTIDGNEKVVEFLRVDANSQQETLRLNAIF